MVRLADIHLHRWLRNSHGSLCQGRAWVICLCSRLFCGSTASQLTACTIAAPPVGCFNTRNSHGLPSVLSVQVQQTIHFKTQTHHKLSNMYQLYNTLPSTLTQTPTLTHVYAGPSAEHHTWPHRDSLSSTRCLTATAANICEVLYRVLLATPATGLCMSIRTAGSCCSGCSVQGRPKKSR